MSDTPTGDNAEQLYAVDAQTPLKRGYTPDELGVLFPSTNGGTFQKATHGVQCHQLPPFSGVYIPVGRPTLRQGYPGWLPRNSDDGVNAGEKHPVTSVDVNDIPQRNYESLPEWVQEREHFYNWDEFMYWLDSDDVWWHWDLDLIEELRLYNYNPTGGLSDVVGRDITEHWEGIDEIWDAINERLSFTYDVVESSERPAEYREEYPGACEGVRWVRITGSRIDGEHWANDMAGELAMLLYPNSD
jgi:hypothetical protein